MRSSMATTMQGSTKGLKIVNRYEQTTQIIDVMSPVRGYTKKTLKTPWQDHIEGTHVTTHEVGFHN